MAYNDEKGGRPPIQWDEKEAAIFGRFRATYKTMSDYYGCSERTIKRLMTNDDDDGNESKFCHHYKNGLSSGQMKLSEAQWKAAQEGNATMLIWLGKQYLGQKDRQEISLDDKRENEPDYSALSEESLREIEEASFKSN